MLKNCSSVVLHISVLVVKKNMAVKLKPIAGPVMKYDVERNQVKRETSRF